ncbi:metal ABC transporter permease [filamentous cyanobacterium LEGE 11480]|uniref:Metal ABC transporter permease n=1 Tax=Romeriopsis navalis LEGE 11480 TaxID=2777977 RepID=A0A928Z5R3_9CYAN|nr:metal ABC transporter permease [Romeriopsis navalis]MBE9031758.1 metal ABC transporter permease [Romeriopsis navalis LEGE 11480]
MESLLSTLPVLGFAEWLITPLTFEFMLKAMGMSMLVGAVCSVLSCYMTLKSWALMGDAVSHSVLPGVVIAYLLGIPFAIGAFVFGLGAVASIGYIESQTRIKEDTVIGIVFTGFFALGIVMISKIRSGVDLNHILFGNPLGISDGDVIQTCIISAIVLTIVLMFRKDFLLFCFDPTHAKTIGLNTTLLHYSLLAALSLTAVAGLQTVGIIMVVAMLITPGATAYLLTDRFDHMLMIATTSGVFSSVMGTYISYYLDGATGGCIVVLQTALFVIAMLFAPKHGILRRRSSGY